MRTTEQILELLPQLDQVVADDLEDQDLDFKEWSTRSMDDAVKLLVEMAVCMANGGGGTVVFGVRDRTAGRSNAVLGVPPEVDVTLLKQDVSAPFRSFVTEETKQGRLPGVDELLVLQYLLRHTELETTLAAELCQRPEAAMRNTLSRMERDPGWIQRGGTGRGTYWILSRALAKLLHPEPVSRNQARIDWETAKTRVMSILKQRSRDREPGLSNADLRAITAFNRDQINRLMRELRQQHPEVQMAGQRRHARYIYGGGNTNS